MHDIWYSILGDFMLHIGKYCLYILKGAGKILFYPLLGKKYVKNKDAYPLQERYDFVKDRANEILIKYMGANLVVSGWEKIDANSTYLFTPNHQGLLDPVCLINIFDKPLIFVSKKEVETTPIIGKINYIIDSIFLDRDSPRDALNMVKLCKSYLNDKQSVVIFPEGTRSKDEEVSIHSYKPGAFKCAYGTGAKIMPIVIDGSYLFLTTKKKNPKKVIKVSFLDPIEEKDYLDKNTTELALEIENRAKIELEKMRKTAI